MAEVWFKLTYSLTGMFPARQIDAPVSIPLPADGNGEIVLWLRTFEKQTGIPPQLCCDALLKRQIKPDLAQMFESLSKRVLPRDESTNIELPRRSLAGVMIDSDGNILDNWVIPLEVMPIKFQHIHREVFQMLFDLTRKFVKTLRWRQGASGAHSPFGFVDFEWSNDKIHWNAMPSTIGARVEVRKGIDTSANAIRALETIWRSGEEEPLGHELLREAFDIAGTSPRSALLIGVSALETSLKNYISFRVPKAHIILDEMPSPPIEKIIQNIIPKLHTEIGLTNTAFPLKEDDRNILRKWITQRNQVTHGRKRTVDVDDLLRFLAFVRTTLYKLDACRGQIWAESLIGTLQWRAAESSVIARG